MKLALIMPGAVARLALIADDAVIEAGMIVRSGGTNFTVAAFRKSEFQNAGVMILHDAPANAEPAFIFYEQKR